MYFHKILFSLSVLMISTALEFGKDNLIEFEKQYLSDKLKFNEDVSNGYPFRNTSLPVDERVKDLVSRLTLEELVLQISRGGAGNNGPAPAIDRLGIKPYNWNTECVHGYMPPGYATGFPSPIGLASSFNATAIYMMAQAVAVEARANHNNFSKHGYYGDHTGLSCFAPVINIMHHPLWGRNQETYGEDPVLTSLMARSYVSGLQTAKQGYAGATAVCKHFGVHSGPEDIPSNRFSFNAEVDDYNFGNTYMTAFRECVALAHGVMCSYNAINGVPACANSKMIMNVLRDKFDFKGYVVSDEGAIEHIDVYFHYTKSPLDTAIASIQAGVNLDLTYFGPNNRFSLLKQAVDEGKVKEDEVIDSAKRLFTVRMILGEFDPPDMNPWNMVSTDEILSKPHLDLAADIAQGTYVLLKNDGLLPLKNFQGSIAFVGPFANNTLAVTGDYASNPHGMFSTPADSWKGLSTLPPTIAAGCVGGWNKDLPLCTKYDSTAIKQSITSDTKLIVVTMGTGTNMEAETRDRANTSLPSNQYQLMEDVIKYANGIPVVLLLYSAGPLNIDRIFNMPAVNAIFMCHFPGMAAGTLTSLWSGTTVPAARLPYTWYKSDFSLPSITEYNISTNGLTYRYVDPNNVFLPFGFGLSYTTFTYANLRIEPSMLSDCEKVQVKVDVTNSGNYDADEVVQVYMSAVFDRSPAIKTKLISFDRIFIARASVVTVTLTIDEFAMAVWLPPSGQSDESDYRLLTGNYTITVGGQQPGQSKVIGSNVLLANLVRTKEVLLSDCDKK